MRKEEWNFPGLFPANALSVESGKCCTFLLTFSGIHQMHVGKQTWTAQIYPANEAHSEFSINAEFLQNLKKVTKQSFNCFLRDKGS